MTVVENPEEKIHEDITHGHYRVAPGNMLIVFLQLAISPTLMEASLDDYS